MWVASSSLKPQDKSTVETCLAATVPPQWLIDDVRLTLRGFTNGGHQMMSNLQKKYWRSNDYTKLCRIVENSKVIPRIQKNGETRDNVNNRHPKKLSGNDAKCQL
jgi:hypothetical protein